MCRHIDYRQTRRQLGMVVIEPFDAIGDFDHEGLVFDLVEGKLDISNNLPLFDLISYRRLKTFINGVFDIEPTMDYGP